MSPDDLIGWVFSAASTGLSLLALAGMVRAVSYSKGVPRVPLTVRRGDGTHVPLGAPGAPPSAW